MHCFLLKKNPRKPIRVEHFNLNAYGVAFFPGSTLPKAHVLFYMHLLTIQHAGKTYCNVLKTTLHPLIQSYRRTVRVQINQSALSSSSESLL